MKSTTLLLLCASFLFVRAEARSGAAATSDQKEAKVEDRAQAAATVLSEIMNAPDKGIPKEVMASAKCMIIIPSMKKAGFIVGGRYGRGFASCRTPNGWSAPAPVFLGGGSWGAQIGAEGVDVVALVMNDRGVQQLLSSKFEVGADVSAAAGPIGRSASAGTDYKLNSEILSYSRSKGLFAGAELSGASIKQDDDSTKELYGKMIPFKEILSGHVATPPQAATLVHEISKDFSVSQASR